MANAEITKSVGWRIYRLPGSREVWHVDSGPDTPIVNVRGFQLNVPCRSVDVGGDNVPRAWIEIPYFNGMELYVIGGIAVCVVPASVLPDVAAGGAADAAVQP
jgi:hypothetical protein